MRGSKDEVVQTIELQVMGMACDRCVNAVTGAAKAVPVSLAENAALITGDGVAVQKLVKAIEAEGYKASRK